MDGWGLWWGEERRRRELWSLKGVAHNKCWLLKKHMPHALIWHGVVGCGSTVDRTFNQGWARGGRGRVMRWEGE